MSNRTKIFTRNNIVIYAAMLTSLMSKQASTEDNYEPSLVKDELIFSPISKRPSTSPGKSNNPSLGGDQMPKRKKPLLSLKKEDIIEALRVANIDAKKCQKFIQRYEQFLKKEKNIRAHHITKSAKYANIELNKFKKMINHLLEKGKEAEEEKLYKYFEYPIKFTINKNGEPSFKSSIKIIDTKAYLEDLKETSKLIAKNKKFKNDCGNIEANNILIKTIAYLETKKLQNEGEYVENADKFFKNFEKEMKYYNIKLNKNGKLEPANKERIISMKELRILLLLRGRTRD